MEWLICMPILTAEPALYPDDLFGCVREESSGSRWWVLHMRPRQEKSLARRLHERQVPFFLPLMPNRLRIRGRVTQSYLPLFGGYLFLLARHDEYHLALSTRRVAPASKWRTRRNYGTTCVKFIVCSVPAPWCNRKSGWSPVRSY